MKALPKTITKKLFICAKRDHFKAEHEYEISLNDFDMSASGLGGYIKLGTADVTVDIPECNPIQAEIEAIKKARDQILADAQLKATNLNEQIQRLLCIEHSA